jgi:4-amino-4-deoxy-L-arabinose transferase-like glycosyltransferase
LILLSIFIGAALTLAAAYGFGVAVLRRIPAPPEIVLGVGASIASILIFLALLFHIGYWPLYLTMGLAGIGALVWIRAKPLDPIAVPRAGMALFAASGIFYLVNALAPEILPDGLTYHLGLPNEYTRLGGFSPRIEFFRILPQGMEMLFTMAFALGRHSAAKLVEFAFFLAGAPLLLRIGKRLGTDVWGALVAAVFYFTAPVIALTGSSSYNDASLVFFTLAAFYLLLVWRDSGDDRYLPLAGLLAGFCYAIKFPGIFTVSGAVLFALALKPRKAAMVVLGAAPAIVPWILRSLVLTRNPAAPLMNSVFRNPWFHVATETGLSKGLASLHQLPRVQIPWELAFGDHLMGIYGPMLFALPLAIVAIRKPAVRLCLAASVVLAIPWFSNTGARFLMPSLVMASLALGVALPQRAARAILFLQAFLCIPPLLDLWLPRYQFRLHEFPLRAALRIEPEDQYLKQHTREYEEARLVDANTPPGSRIFSLIPVADAYLNREVVITWTSAEGDRMTDAIRTAALYPQDWFFDWKAHWPSQPLRALRFRMPASFDGEWDISEVVLYSDDVPIYSSPQWTLRAWPNRWETPLAFDRLNLTHWRTWENIRKGDFVEVDFDHPQRLTQAVLRSHTPAYGLILEFYGQDLDGKWRRLTNFSDAILRPKQDLRMEVATTLRRAGFRYLLAPTRFDVYARLGQRMLAEAPEWGLEPVANTGAAVLFRVR